MKTGNVIHHLIPEILFKFQAKNSFKMAAMPFPFIGILLIRCNFTNQKTNFYASIISISQLPLCYTSQIHNKTCLKMKTQSN